ncbi:MAG: aminotransferase DegT [Desulfatitalea sp. BRH_c12]|nr:MAG: aminotransferase DegT [Desulfatitalea sp. BRH_c12]
MLAQKIVAILKRLLPLSSGAVGLHEPRFEGNEITYLGQCIQSTYVSYVGKFVDRFEDMLAEFTGARHAVAVVNGTAALHLSLVATGVRPQDEVLVPALTFVATANAISYLNAIPHFVDAEPKTMGVDPVKLDAYLRDVAVMRGTDCYNRASGRRIAALIPMHTFGHPADLDSLLDICQRYNLVMIEDAAEALGSMYKNVHTGRFGRCGIFSFNGNKTITTGGGGAIITDDSDLAQTMRYLSTTAKVPHRFRYYHDRVGFNYRMPNINAAVGCAQLEKIDGLLQKKRTLAAIYADAFSGIDGVTVFREPAFARSNYWLNALLLAPEKEHDIEDILEATHQCGIATRPVWQLMHELPMYQHCQRMSLDMSERLQKCLINIPSSPFLVPKCHKGSPSTLLPKPV